MKHSDYIVYVDESGDHGLASINNDYPVFVLVFCIIRKESYAGSIVPQMQRLKFEYFGHDCVVLHSHEIRKAHGEFQVLLNSTVRGNFLESINTLMRDADFTVIASVIDKRRLVRQYASPANPYDIAMTFCMERTHRFLDDLGQTNKKTHIIFERRGTREDNQLELAFRRVIDGANAIGPLPHLDIKFAHKIHNSTGLQLADLAAYPIGRHCIKPDRENRAYDIVRGKLRRSPRGEIVGWGLKLFP